MPKFKSCLTARSSGSKSHVGRTKSKLKILIPYGTRHCQNYLPYHIVIITVVFRFKQDVGKTKDLAFNSKILLKSEILLKSNMI